MPQPLATNSNSKLQLQIDAVYALAEKASATSVLDYLHFSVIDSRPEPRPFREKAEPWQWGLANRLAPAFEHAAGIRKDYAGPFCFWLTLPKGHDKSSLIARLTNWALAFNSRQFTGYVAASDRQQAGYLAEAMLNEAALNPWLNRRIEFKNWNVVGQHEAKIEILAADAASSQGIRGDLIILDEVTHWKSRDLYDAIKSGIRKRPGCVFVVITNAGLLYTWQHEELMVAKKSPHWSVYEAPGRLASWMDEIAIAEDRKSMPSGIARRLFDNAWVAPGDDNGFVSREEAQRCADLGQELNLLPVATGDPAKEYVGAIDYGSVKDRCVLTILHQEAERVLVDKMEVWQGSRQAPTSIEAVERWIDDIRKSFRLRALVVDQYQMESTCQRYTGLVPIVRWNPRGGQSNHTMAQVLRALVVNRNLAWYPGCGDLITKKGIHTLVDELSEVICKQMGYGFRVDHLPGQHDDRVICLAMAVVELLQSAPRRPVFMGEHFW